MEEVKARDGEISIPFTKYELDNGLTVILHEDHSDPIAHVDVTYHVGSAREEIGKSGFAHFFEHMMFQGSDHVGDEEHFKIVSESGGNLNGTTNRDRTNYFETIPANQLETALWLEADRMGFLLDAVTQEKFEVQRATVKNERGQNYDNRPYGLASEYGAKSLYPYGHPYSWLTIGYVEDLDRVDVNDLKNFFLRWYGPNNAVLTVAGDLDKEETMRKIVKYFGSIPRGPEVEKMHVPLPQLAQDRYVSYVDNYAQAPLLAMVWPTPGRYHEDEAPLDALAEIIGQGKNSIFYKNLEKTKKTMNAYAYNSTSELAGEFSLRAIAFPHISLTEIENEFRNALQEFEQTGVSDEALKRFKSSYESSFYEDLQSVGSWGGKASKLANYHTFAGDANYIQRDLQRYLNVTKEDVMRVYNKYVKDKHAVVLSVLPKGDFVAAHPDNYVIDQSNYQAPDYGYAGLTYNKAKDNFDRSQRPKSGKNPAIIIPEYTRYEFENGMKVLQTDYNETPNVVVELSLDAGELLNQNNLDKAGLADIFADMMNEGTQSKSAEEFSSALDKLGSSVYFYANNEEVGAYIQTLEKNLTPTLELFKEKLMQPKFEQEALDRFIQKGIQNIENNKKDPATIARNVFNKVIYQKNDIRSLPFSGTKESLQSITLQDIENYYQNLNPNIASLLIVGEMSKEELAKEFNFLNIWRNQKEVKYPTLPQPKKLDQTTIYFVNVDDAAQSQIRMGYPLDLPFDATGEFNQVNNMNYVLGGAFNSRINLNLREDKGWSYGARSFFWSSKIPGYFMAYAGVKREPTAQAVSEFLKEINLYVDKGITADELAFTKNSIGQSEALEYETPYDKLNLLSKILEYDLPKGFNKEQQKVLNQMTVEEVNALAKKYLKTNQLAIVVVGDKKTVWDDLVKLGYPMIELDADGNVIN